MHYIFSLCILFISQTSLITLAFSETFTFDQSRRFIQDYVYRDNPYTFYTECEYQIDYIPGEVYPDLTPFFDSCKNYKVEPRLPEILNISWHYVVPNERFAKVFECWNYDEKDPCADNFEYQNVLADMHNMVPDLNTPYSRKSATLQFETHPFLLIYHPTKTIPRKSVLGDIARIYFYMSDRYKFRLSTEEKNTLNAWHNADPVDEWERTKNFRVYELQGTYNSYIESF